MKRGVEPSFKISWDKRDTIVRTKFRFIDVFYNFQEFRISFSQQQRTRFNEEENNYARILLENP